MFYLEIKKKKGKKAEEKQIKEYFKNNHDIVIGEIYFNDSDKIFIPKVFLNHENNKLSTMMI